MKFSTRLYLGKLAKIAVFKKYFILGDSESYFYFKNWSALTICFCWRKNSHFWTAGLAVTIQDSIQNYIILPFLPVTGQPKGVEFDLPASNYFSIW
jgi:hypothetical protein